MISILHNTPYNPIDFHCKIVESDQYNLLCTKKSNTTLFTYDAVPMMAWMEPSDNGKFLRNSSAWMSPVSRTNAVLVNFYCCEKVPWLRLLIKENI